MMSSATKEPETLMNLTYRSNELDYFQRMKWANRSVIPLLLTTTPVTHEDYPNFWNVANVVTLNWTKWQNVNVDDSGDVFCLSDYLWFDAAVPIEVISWPTKVWPTMWKLSTLSQRWQTN